MKKFLSFFLVLCMLITAVPALLLPVMAEEGEAATKIFSYKDAYEGFTKTVSETLFKEAGYADDAAYKAWLELPETFAFNQGEAAWKAGEYDPSTGTFEAFSRVAFYCQDVAWDSTHDVSWITTDTAYKAALDKYIESANAGGGKGGASIWGGTPLMGQRVYNGLTNTNTAKTAAFVFTAEEEGYYMPFIQGDIVDGGASGHKYAILVNGEAVWPLDAKATDYSTWYAIAGATTVAEADVNAAIAETLEPIELYEGDKVYFAVQGSGMPTIFTPAVEQKPAPEPVKFSFADEFQVSYNISEVFRMKGAYDAAAGTGLIDSADAFATTEEYLAWLLADDTFKVTQESNWRVGQYQLGGTFTPFTRILFMASDSSTIGHDMNWVSTEEIYTDLATKYVNGESSNIWNGAPLWHLHAGAAYKFEAGIDPNGNTIKPGGITTSGNGFISAIQYTVAEGGNYGISFTKFEHLLDSSHKFAILVNDQPVWPATATADKTDGWFNISSSSTTLEGILAEVEPISFKASVGDTVSFCVAGAGNAVFMDPVLVQKPGGAIYLTLSDAYGSNTKSIKTRPGSTITLPKYQGDLIFFGWDSNGDGKADIADEGQFTIGEENAVLTSVVMQPSLWYENRPVWGADETVHFSGGWVAGAYEKATMTFSPYAYNVGGGIFIAPFSNGPWGMTGGGFYVQQRECCFVVTGCVDPEILADTPYARPDDEIGSYIQSIQKTVDYNGTAQIDFNLFRISRELGSNAGTECPVAGGMAIYVNGEKVWPLDTENEYFHFVSEEVYTDSATRNIDFKKNMTDAGTWPFPLSVDVEMGDVIDIRYVQGTKDNWMLYSEPKVTFTDLAETPTVGATSVDIAKDFTLNVYADILAKAEGTTVAMEYWNAEPTAEQLAAGGTDMGAAVQEGNLYKFAYAGLTAKQMTDVIYVRPYTVNEAGDKNYGVVVPVSIKAYAMAAMGQSEALDNLLVAMLNYGANAQSLFGYKVDDAANADLSEEQKRATADMSSLVDVYNNEDGANKIKNVSLIMGTDIGMKYMIDSVEGATTYELEVSKNADFSESTKIAMEAAWEGKEQKAIYNVGFAELGDTFYVRAVVDGEAGATLTYSVDSYVIRISESCSDGLYFAAMSLAYLGQMIEAYNA